MKRIILAVLLLSLSGAAVLAGWGGVVPVVPVSQSIVSVGPATGSFLAGAGSANATVSTEAATMSPSVPTFAGTWSLSGTDAGKFKIDSSTGVISVCNTAPTCTDLSAGTYNVTAIATQAGAGGSPYPQAVVITGTSGAQTITGVSPTVGSFTGGAGSANALVSNEAATMSPSTPAFSGTWSLSGTDAGKFKINSSTGQLTVCNTAPSCTDLAAGSYSINVIATQAGATGSPFPVAMTITGVAAGAAIATETFVNQGVAMVAGDPVTLGQAFRRGDVPAGNCVRPRNATSHANLVYQLDEIADRVENGDDGSKRHLVYSVQYDSSVTTGGTGKIEWVLTGTSCPTSTQKQALSAFTAAYDFQIVFTDVRNQSGSVRNTGNMIWSANRHASNSGRDAPRKYATGPVRDGWVVMGAPEYVTGGTGPSLVGATYTGQKDPLILVSCYFDLFTSPSDQTSLGRVRHVCRVDSPWEAVASGSTGLGSGPAGFANDPQGIYYRPQVFNGTTSIIDWARLDKTVSASSNPINLTTGQFTIPGINIHNDNGASWFEATPVCITSSGSMPAGFTSPTNCGSGGKLFFSEIDYAYLDTDRTVFGDGPYNLINLHIPVDAFNPSALGPPTSQGTGTLSFSYRTYHPKFMSWYTLNETGRENWFVGGVNSNQPIYPALTSGERLYWQQSGVLPPIDMSQTPSGSSLLDLGFRIGYTYNPMSRMAVKGASSPGPRSDIGIISEFASQAMILQTPASYDHARSFALGIYPYKWILNEATGRIPAMNNGPLNGPVGNGIGNSYPVLGAPQPSTFFQCDQGGRYGGLIVPPVDDTPVVDGSYAGAFWGHSCGYSNDHVPNFDGIQYAMFGSRHYLENNFFAGMRSMAQNFPGPVDGLRDNIIGSNHYWNTGMPNDEERFGFWAFRDQMNCARFGAPGPEKAYCLDLITENGHYWTAYLPWKDGAGNTGVTDCACIPRPVPDYQNQTFMETYGTMSFYMAYVNLRDPMSYSILSNNVTKNVIVLAGDVPGGMSSYYANTGTYSYGTSLRDSAHRLRGPNVGQYYDSNMAHQNISSVYPVFNGTSTVTASDPRLVLSQGDTLWSFNFDVSSTGTPSGPNELLGGIGYVITNVDNTNHTFKIINPATGVPFTSFNFNGAPFVADYTAIGFHPNYSQPTSWWGGDGGYSIYLGSEIAALKILGLGSVSFLTKTVNDAYNTAWNVRLIQSDPTGTWIKWDPSIVVP